MASAILVVAFSLPIGAERLARTQYERLEGFVGSFEASGATDAGAKSAPTAGTDTWGLMAQAVRQKYTPIEANALLSRVESLTKAKETAEKAAAHSARLKIRKHALPAAPLTVAASSA
ncbi:MAG: hypothetical protein Q7J64_01130, partial [Elusimicrobiota bacterium]|nr:hypothetical protein [Elusimicrobiota bacterium]